MTEQFNVASNEHGIIRLFTILPETDLNTFAARPAGTATPDDRPWPLGDALGVDDLDANFVEIFDVTDLTGVGLADYMIDGLGIAEADIAPHRAQLEAIRGNVLIVFSSAFGGHSATITPRAPLRWIGTFTEETAPVQFEPLPSGDAKGNVNAVTRSPPSDAAISGRVASVVLLVLALLVGLMIWIAA